jgi:type VI secretion system protein ImpE
VSDRISELVKGGDVDGAMAEAKALVRRRASEAEPRILLFQLFCVVGDWERAAIQLEIARQLDPSTEMMVRTYHSAIVAEAMRQRVIDGEARPMVIGRPAAWIARMVEALRLDAAGEGAAAMDMRAAALEEAPASPGTLDGTPFVWIADADPRFGPVLEAVVRGAYWWVPFDRLTATEMEPPSDLRDLVWTPAVLHFPNGGNEVALLPARYPGSWRETDRSFALGRRTDWRETAGGGTIGLGQRMFVTDAADAAILDVRSLVLTAPSVEAADAFDG